MFTVDMCSKNTLLIKTFFIILFCLNQQRVLSQSEKKDFISPKITTITTLSHYNFAKAYFERVIVYRRSEYHFTKEHLTLAENYLHWSKQNEEKKRAHSSKILLVSLL